MDRKRSPIRQPAALAATYSLDFKALPIEMRMPVAPRYDRIAQMQRGLIVFFGGCLCVKVRLALAYACIEGMLRKEMVRKEMAGEPQPQQRRRAHRAAQGLLRCQRQMGHLWRPRPPYRLG